MSTSSTIRRIILSVVPILACTQCAWAAVTPGSLLIYYGYPSSINGTPTIAQAAAVFGQYDMAVIGDGLQDGPGDPLPHEDHANTVAIISHAATENTLFFGYIDLGVYTDNHSLSEIYRRVDAWQEMGIDGIFLDDFGYDYGVTRVRQNAAVSYVHSKGLPVCANGWFPDDMFGNIVNSSNPSGTPTQLGATDYYLSESHQVSEGTLISESSWQTKANQLQTYQNQLGFEIISITTNDEINQYDQNEFFYAWYSAALYGHYATGWGEYNFSATSGLAPYRSRPAEPLGTVFKSSIDKTGSIYDRTTERGTIRVNAGNYTYTFIADPDEDGDNVANAYDDCPGTPPGSSVDETGRPRGDIDCNCIVDLKDFAIIQQNFGR